MYLEEQKWRLGVWDSSSKLLTSYCCTGTGQNDTLDRLGGHACLEHGLGPLHGWLDEFALLFRSLGGEWTGHVDHVFHILHSPVNTICNNLNFVDFVESQFLCENVALNITTCIYLLIFNMYVYILDRIHVSFDPINQYILIS